MSKIEIRNPGAKVVLIDDTYENLILREKGSFNFSPDLLDERVLSFGIYGGLPPTLALRCTNAGGAEYIEFVGAAVRYIRITGNTINFHLYGFSSSVAWTKVEWFLFDTPSSVLAGSGVVVLRNRTTGRVTFDSDQKYMKIVDHFSLNKTPNVDIVKNYTPGRMYAAVQNKPFYTFEAYTDDSEFPVQYVKNTQLSATRFEDGMLVINQYGITEYNFPSSPMFVSSPFCYYMILDVTNL